MSLRLIISFVFFLLLTVYFAFLNPGDIDLRLARDHTPVQVPVVVFLLAAILIGVLLTSVFTSFTQIKNSFIRFLKTRALKKRTRQQVRWEKLFQKAESSLEGGHRDKGLSLLDKILNDNPNHIPSLILQGNIYRQMGNIEQALARHQQAVEQDRENPRAHLCLAEDYSAAGKPGKTINALQQARHLEPDSLVTLRKLRGAYLAQGNWKLILQIQKSILSHVSNAGERKREREYSSQLAFLRGCEWIQQRQIEPAISELRRAIKENPKSLPPYIQLGDLYHEADNLKAAIKIWKTGFEQTQSSICLLRLRSAYEQLDKPDEVIKLYQEAAGASQNSEKETLVITLAGLYLDQGHMEKAIQTLWDISSPSIPAHLYLIKAHQDKNEAEKADQVIRAALKKVTTSLSRFVCGKCHREFDRWSGVCPECQAWDSLDTAIHQTL